MRDGNPKPIWIISPSPQVFSLPMRDGNILTQVPWDVFEGFLVYL